MKEHTMVLEVPEGYAPFLFSNSYTLNLHTPLISFECSVYIIRYVIYKTSSDTDNLSVCSKKVYQTLKIHKD